MSSVFHRHASCFMAACGIMCALACLAVTMSRYGGAFRVWRQAGSFVRALPHQLDEQIERGGANLSGGQRQRLCIARALIRDPRILILDDASSALDFRTDAALRKGLREAFPQTTRLIVSQRAGTLCACDRILVMQDGVCVGFDTHARLYDDCAVYRGICQTQGVSREGVSA